MENTDRVIRVGQQEVESLLGLKFDLDHKEMLASNAVEYQKLGWDLVGLDARDNTDLPIAFGGSPEIWLEQLWQPGLAGIKINLGIHTGSRSGLLVLEVSKGPGEKLLERCGAWRAACVAALGDSRERHFYSWEASLQFDPASFGAPPGLSWFGEGQVVLAPPSLEGESREAWRWLCPPWKKRPQPPSLALCELCQQLASRKPEEPNSPRGTLSPRLQPRAASRKPLSCRRTGPIIYGG